VAPGVIGIVPRRSRSASPVPLLIATGRPGKGSAAASARRSVRLDAAAPFTSLSGHISPPDSDP
jgi:hypothetical protein